jgi:hypothetical protein
MSGRNQEKGKISREELELKEGDHRSAELDNSTTDLTTRFRFFFLDQPSSLSLSRPVNYLSAHPIGLQPQKFDGIEIRAFHSLNMIGLQPKRTGKGYEKGKQA